MYNCRMNPTNGLGVNKSYKINLFCHYLREFGKVFQPRRCSSHRNLQEMHILRLKVLLKFFSSKSHSKIGIPLITASFLEFELRKLVKKIVSYENNLV